MDLEEAVTKRSRERVLTADINFDNETLYWKLNTSLEVSLENCRNGIVSHLC